MPVPAPRPPVLRSTRLMVRSTWEGWRARELRGWHGQSWIAHCGSMGCSGPANAARPTSSGHTHTRVRERAHARARVHTHTRTPTHPPVRGRPHGAHASAPVHTCPHLGVLLRAVLGLLRQNVDVLVQPRAVDGVDVRLGLRGGVGWGSSKSADEGGAASNKVEAYKRAGAHSHRTSAARQISKWSKPMTASKPESLNQG